MGRQTGEILPRLGGVEEAGERRREPIIRRRAGAADRRKTRAKGVLR
jgi:hypothetical protein